ncbi:MAG: UDP-glucosyltransferase [Akkermansiaceae bacterium]|nr:UDP-glucosyltransferase [Armatimonadota bacterium]
MRLHRKSAPLRVLCYAVNGLGLGHITRLVSIARELRRLAWLLDLPVEIAFLTTSEGDSIATLHDFPAFKIPSRAVATSAGFEAGRYRKLAKQWIWNAVGLFTPDLFLVDTFPAGVFEELLDVLDFGQKNVFVYRAVRPGQAKSPLFQSALRAYDLILKPGESGETGNNSPVPSEIEHRVVPTGTILIRSRSEMLARTDAREALGLPETGDAVYVSVGGGGDKEAEAQYRMLTGLATYFWEAHLVFGAGALYLGREWHAPNVTWTRRPLMASCFRAFDAAVTAGGYNTVAELLHAGVPCVFLPQPRSHDDQGARVSLCVERGAGVLPQTNSVDAIAAALSELLEPAKRASASGSAGSLVPVNHASLAAEESMALLVDRESLERASDLRDTFVEDGGHVPDGWKEVDFMRALGILSAQLLIDDTDSDDAPLDALRATRAACEASNQKGKSPRETIAELRQRIVGL